MIDIVINDVRFEVYAERALWQARNDFPPADPAWAALARALVCCDYVLQDEHLFVQAGGVDYALMQPVEPGSLIHVPVEPDALPLRAKRVITGQLDGHPLVSVLEWDDPLDAVMTTAEAEHRFGMAEGSVRKAVLRDQIVARKSAGTHLIRRADALRLWG